MPSADQLLRPGYQRQTTVTRAKADGFYAEADPAGQLRHFGYYRQGEPIGWTLTVEPSRMFATRTITRMAGGEEAAETEEEWLREMVSTIYREADAEHRVCLFCHKTSAEVATLIAGPERHSYICDACVTTCARILAEQQTP